MITMNSNSVAPKATNPAFKGFLQIKSVNKLKNGGLREAIDTFVLNTDGTVRPLEKDEYETKRAMAIMRNSNKAKRGK